MYIYIYKETLNFVCHVVTCIISYVTFAHFHINFLRKHLQLSGYLNL